MEGFGFGKMKVCGGGWRCGLGRFGLLSCCGCCKFLLLFPFL